MTKILLKNQFFVNLQDYFRRIIVRNFAFSR